MKVQRFDHIVLTVRSIDATCDFYTRVLGMEVVTFPDGRTALHLGEQKINLHAAGHELGAQSATSWPGSGDLCFVT
jgi:catechol 2,3-dioxygenase-like lactoylglutathione lyase family enzyme